MEEKFEEICALLSAGSYPQHFDKSKRQNLRRYASKFNLRGEKIHSNCNKFYMHGRPFYSLDIKQKQTNWAHYLVIMRYFLIIMRSFLVI